MGKTLRMALILALLSLTAISVSYIVFVNRRRAQLDAFLQQINTVEIGKTGLDEWKKQLEQAKVSNFQVVCGEGVCGLGMREENRYLARLRLAPPTVADVSVSFRNGVASEIYILLEVLRRDATGKLEDDKGVVVRQSTDRPESCRQHYGVLLHQRSSNTEPYWAGVAMDVCAEKEERARAIAINTHCLTKVGGCTTIEMMLPNVLRDRSQWSHFSFTVR